MQQQVLAPATTEMHGVDQNLYRLSALSVARWRCRIHAERPSYREVLVLRDLEGFSYREIANHLEMDRKKVKWMLFKARQRIQRIVGEKDEKYEKD